MDDSPWHFTLTPDKTPPLPTQTPTVSAQVPPPPPLDDVSMGPEQSGTHVGPEGPTAYPPPYHGVLHKWYVDTRTPRTRNITFWPAGGCTNSNLLIFCVRSRSMSQGQWRRRFFVLVSDPPTRLLHFLKPLHDVSQCVRKLI
jgi:hypothetical protein